MIYDTYDDIEDEATTVDLAALRARWAGYACGPACPLPGGGKGGEILDPAGKVIGCWWGTPWHPDSIEELMRC